MGRCGVLMPSARLRSAPGRRAFGRVFSIYEGMGSLKSNICPDWMMGGHVGEEGACDWVALRRVGSWELELERRAEGGSEHSECTGQYSVCVRQQYETQTCWVKTCQRR